MAKLFNFDELIKSGVNQAMEECELTIGMTLKEAVEKQIPKKVIKNEGYWEINCPYCLTDIAEEKGNEYCVICGQRLDWSDEE
jgi:rRNA maturation endonuclease Nob1